MHMISNICIPDTKGIDIEIRCHHQEFIPLGDALESIGNIPSSLTRMTMEFTELHSHATGRTITWNYGEDEKVFRLNPVSPDDMGTALAGITLISPAVILKASPSISTIS